MATPASRGPRNLRSSGLSHAQSQIRGSGGPEPGPANRPGPRHSSPVRSHLKGRGPGFGGFAKIMCKRECGKGRNGFHRV